MQKKETRTKSSRKPLRDVSNGVKQSKSVIKKKPPPENEDPVLGDDGDVLDRLLLAHSDLSTLVHQIDELVARALQHKVTNKKGRKEIESFASVLSETQASLKLWVPRLQSALSSPPKGLENQLEHSLASKTIPPQSDDISEAVDSSIETELDSLISPSPLVSWRADCTTRRANCTTESSRQLFLLTPLPRTKALFSKLRVSSKSALEKTTSNTIASQPSLLSICDDNNDNLLLDSVKKSESTREFGFLSPPKVSKRDCSMIVMTPSLKMSPPKSCMLLEPISEFSHKDSHIVRKSTPFPVGIQNLSESDNSESSSGQVSEHLSLKYPELFGIKPAHKLGNGRNMAEESPNWFMSPPKTCVLMEPPDEKPQKIAATDLQLPRTASILDQKTILPLVTEKDNQVGHFMTNRSRNPELGDALALVESTPLWKERESTIRMGKRPGENTLKKELWTRFEAATSDGLRFNVSVLGDNTAQKGFLDRLEEVSCDEKNFSE